MNNTLQPLAEKFRDTQDHEVLEKMYSYLDKNAVLFRRYFLSATTSATEEINLNFLQKGRFVRFLVDANYATPELLEVTIGKEETVYVLFSDLEDPE